MSKGKIAFVFVLLLQPKALPYVLIDFLLKYLSVCEWNMTKTSSLEKGYKLILPTQTSLFLLKLTEAMHNTSLPGFILEVHEKKTHEYKNISSDYNIQLKVF